MFVNILGYKAIKSIGEPKRAIGFAVAAVLVLALPWTYGIMVLNGADEYLASINKSIRVSIIQPNLDPKVKWDKSKRDNIYRLYGTCIIRRERVLLTLLFGLKQLRPRI